MGSRNNICRMRGSLWDRCHAEHIRAANSYRPALPGEFRLALVGDSIIEGWTTRACCTPISNESRVTAFADSVPAKRWIAPLNVGMAGDTPRDLIWRLKHGEISEHMASDPRLIFVVHIGSDALGNRTNTDAVASQVHEVI